MHPRVAILALVLLTVGAGPAAATHFTGHHLDVTFGNPEPGGTMDVRVLLRNPSNSTATIPLQLTFTSLPGRLDPHLELPVLRDELVVGPGGETAKTYPVPVTHTAPVYAELVAEYSGEWHVARAKSSPPKTLTFDGATAVTGPIGESVDVAFTLTGGQPFHAARLRLLPAVDPDVSSPWTLHEAPGAPLFTSSPEPGATRFGMAEGATRDFSFTWKLLSAGGYVLWPVVEADGVLHFVHSGDERVDDPVRLDVRAEPPRVHSFVAWLPATAAAALVLGGWRFHARRTP